MRSAASCANSMQQQQLREGVVLAGEALGQPALAMPSSCGKSQACRPSPVPPAGRSLRPLRGSTSRSVSLASRKATSFVAASLRSSSVWMLASPTIGAFSVLVGMSAVESDVAGSRR